MSTTRRRFLAAGGAAGALSAARAHDAFANDRSADLGRRLNDASRKEALRRGLFERPVSIASVDLLHSGRHFLVRARSRDGAEGLAEANGAVLESAWPSS